MSHTRWRYGAVLAALALTSACGGAVRGTGSFQENAAQVPDAKIPINGLPSNGPTEVDKIAGNAINDIQLFWTAKFPEVFDGKAYKGPQGGFFSVDPSDSSANVPCTHTAAEIRGNAFYCPSRDIVAWDRINLFPKLNDQFGKFLIAMVLAHEWGHVIQTKSGVDPDKTIVRETQADCYAGAFTRWALGGQAPHFAIDRKDLDNALAGYLLFRDPVGSDANDQQAHGNGFDRINAFQEGFEDDAGHCKTAFTDDRKFTEIQFTRPDDQQNGGNLPFDGTGGALTVGQQDLASTWPTLFQQTYNKAFAKPNTTVSTSGALSCPGGPGQQKAVLFCPQDNSLKLDHDSLKDVYDKVDGGDYAPMTLVGVGYAESVALQAGLGNNDQAVMLRRVICLDGAYTATVVNRTATNNQVTLSPGDLDEAVQALLFYAGTDKFFGDPDQMSGFDRIQAYRHGFSDIKSCSTLS